MRTGSQAADGQVTPATFSFQKLALHCPPDSGPPGPGFTPLLSSSSLALLIFLVLFYPSLCLCCPHLVPLVHTLNHGTLSEVRVSTEESSSMKVVPLWGLSMKVKQRNGRPSRLVLEQRAVPILAALFISSAPQSKFLNLSSPRFHICQVARTGCIHRAVQRVKWVCICPGPAAMPAPPQVLSNDSFTLGDQPFISHTGPRAHGTETPGSASLWWVGALPPHPGLTGNGRSQSYYQHSTVRPQRHRSCSQQPIHSPPSFQRLFRLLPGAPAGIKPCSHA